MSKKSPTPNTPSTPDDLATLLTHAYLAHASRLEALLAGSGLPKRVTAGAGPVLFALSQRDNVTLGALSLATGHAPSTVTGVVGNLSKAGLVKRVKNPEDARSTLVSLSVKGVALKNNLKSLRKDLAKVSEAGLSQTQLKAMKSGLARVSANLRSSGE